MWLSAEVLASHAWGLGLSPQYYPGTRFKPYYSPKGEEKQTNTPPKKTQEVTVKLTFIYLGGDSVVIWI